MLFGILIALLPLLFGYAIKISNTIWLTRINQSLMLTIYIILFLMGCELAQIDNLLTHLPHIILTILLLFLCTFGLNFIILFIIDVFLPWRYSSENREQDISRLKMILESLRICIALILGFVVGLIPLSIWQYNDVLTKMILIIILILVGIQLRSNGISLKQIIFNKVGLTTTMIVIVSSLCGGLIVSYLLELPINTSLAMSSGFGWYSLSGVLMSDAQGSIIGSITFLNDILREVCAIILIPSLIKRYKLTSLGICGATSMDFTLPMLQKGGGLMIVPAAIVQGFLLTLIVPILIPFFNNYF